MSGSEGRPYLMIPGPLEMDPEVLSAAGSIGTSHIDPTFITTFGNVIRRLRDVFMAPDGQPFVVAGSGSLGWDMFGANVLESGDEVLVITQGYFGDSFAEWLQNQGCHVTILSSPAPGTFPDVSHFLNSLPSSSPRFRAVCMTHVDTSTAVVCPIPSIVQIIRRHSPDAVIAVDSVAGLGGESLLMTEWDVDFVMTASQKALAAPAGLSITVARPRALLAAEKRHKAPQFTYVSWVKWRPIMKAYEEGKVAYFATPAVGLVQALDRAIEKHLQHGGPQRRHREHTEVGKAFRAAIRTMGLKTVAEKEELCASTLTAIWYPEGISGDALRTAIKKHGAIVAGGLHKEVGTKYFRVGHMGYSVYGARSEHVLRAINAIEAALLEQNYKLDKGAAAAAFETALQKAAL